MSCVIILYIANPISVLLRVSLPDCWIRTTTTRTAGPMARDSLGGGGAYQKRNLGRDVSMFLWLADGAFQVVIPAHFVSWRGSEFSLARKPAETGLCLEQKAAHGSFRPFQRKQPRGIGNPHGGISGEKKKKRETENRKGDVSK